MSSTDLEKSISNSSPSSTAAADRSGPGGEGVMSSADEKSTGTYGKTTTTQSGSDEDVEKRILGHQDAHDPSTTPLDRQTSVSAGSYTILHKALRLGRVEEKGIQPLPLEERTSTRFYNIFTIWFSMNTNILGTSFGILGPTAYGLSLRDSSLVILFFSLLSTTVPAYFATFGPKTGMRQMIQARFAFGRYLVSIPVLLNMATLTGFIVVMNVIGGQCLSAVSDGNLSTAVGIVIISVLSLLISFCGFNVLHAYEMYAFGPAIVALVIAVGCGGKGLHHQAPAAEPATAANVLSFGMIVASYMIPWACIASDLTTYFDPKVPTWRVFAYSYTGLLIPSTLIMILGAAMAGALGANPSWNDGYNVSGVGGILAAMLHSAGGFGKFIVVVLSLTLLGNTAGTMYAITLNFQTLIPWLVRVPRYLFAIVVTAVVIPVSIKAATNFFDNLNNFVAVIGYWSASFCGIMLIEWHIFRHGNPAEYDHAIWSNARKLPLGAAAISAAVLSFGLVIPCMSQVWWTGPIAKTTGDIGFEMAMVLSALLYLPLRYCEKKYTGR